MGSCARTAQNLAQIRRSRDGGVRGGGWGLVGAVTGPVAPEARKFRAGFFPGRRSNASSLCSGSKQDLDQSFSGPGLQEGRGGVFCLVTDNSVGCPPSS